MWRQGVIGVPKDVAEKPTAIHYWVKSFTNPSRYGINNGCISKMMLKIDGEVVCNYDRGWDIYPTCKAAEIAVEILLYEIDGRSNE